MKAGCDSAFGPTLSQIAASGATWWGWYVGGPGAYHVWTDQEVAVLGQAVQQKLLSWSLPIWVPRLDLSGDSVADYQAARARANALGWTGPIALDTEASMRGNPNLQGYVDGWNDAAAEAGDQQVVYGGGNYVGAAHAWWINSPPPAAGECLQTGSGDVDGLSVDWDQADDAFPLCTFMAVQPPAPNPKPPPTTPTLIWPWAQRIDGPNPGQDGSGQWRHVDQGIDMQADVGMPLLALADGTIRYAHDPNGFGDPYPVLELDVPQPNGTHVYYGHNHPEVPEGAHVRQGDVVAHASANPGGNAAGMPGWLELGWWRNGPTGDGQAMHDAMMTAPAFSGPLPPSPTPGPHWPETPVTLPTGEQGMKIAVKVPIGPDGRGHAPLPSHHVDAVASIRFNGMVDAHGNPVERAAPTWDADEVNGMAQINLYGTILTGGFEDCTVWCSD